MSDRARENQVNPARARLDQAIAMACREQPPAGLADRLTTRIESLSLLSDELDQSSRHSAKTLGLGLLAVAAAAAALFMQWLRPQPAPISAERMRVEPPAATPAPSASTPSVLVRPASVACLNAPVAAGTAPLIDDFEDEDDSISPLEGRFGFWRWARETDAPGTAPALLPVPRPGATPNNRFALHVKGSQLIDWGATVEFAFEPACYDASKYKGITFEARGPGRIYVAPRETSVIPPDKGGSCETDCHNPHVLKIDLDKGFRRYAVRWEEVRQRGLGKAPLDATRLHGLAFLIRPEDTPYDVWIDDVRFLP